MSDEVKVRMGESPERTETSHPTGQQRVRVDDGDGKTPLERRRYAFVAAGYGEGMRAANLRSAHGLQPKKRKAKERRIVDGAFRVGDRFQTPRALTAKSADPSERRRFRNEGRREMRAKLEALAKARVEDKS
jgi:hypothetical protein